MSRAALREELGDLCERFLRKLDAAGTAFVERFELRDGMHHRVETERLDFGSKSLEPGRVRA